MRERPATLRLRVMRRIWGRLRTQLPATTSQPTSTAREAASGLAAAAGAAVAAAAVQTLRLLARFAVVQLLNGWNTASALSCAAHTGLRLAEEARHGLPAADQPAGIVLDS